MASVHLLAPAVLSVAAPRTCRTAGAARGPVQVRRRAKTDRSAVRACLTGPRGAVLFVFAAGSGSGRRSWRRRQWLDKKPVSLEATAAAPAPAAPARVSKRVSDLAIVVTSPLGEEDDERLPQVGDSVQFAGGAVGHVIALSDLCFAAALSNPDDEVAEGDAYKILPKSVRPTVTVPTAGGAFVDATGKSLDADHDASPVGTEDNEVPWFNDIVGLTRRQRIDTPLHAGVMGLDAFVPIGRGQSMLLRLPASVDQAGLFQFYAHIISAQAGNNVRCFAVASTPAEGRDLQRLVTGSEAGSRLTIVAGSSERARPGEAVLAMNAACALAEAHRDAGGDALLLLDLEPLHRVWADLAEISNKEGLTEKANRKQNEEIEKLPEELGVELWRYVAKRNAITARRRTFLGCFLQRAGRMAWERGGGSLTLLAFARLKDDSQLSRLELEAKLRNIKQMQKLQDAVRQKAVEKIEAQLAALPDDRAGSGVPDAFIEEAKAVTDGHVVFLDGAVDSDGRPRWCVDIHESVARGITADSVQNRPLHLLKSLNLKMHLMQEEQEGNPEAVVDVADAGTFKLDRGPLLALMQQPVGDVLSVEDEAALLLLALDDAMVAAASRPLVEAANALLARARVRSTPELSVAVRLWAEQSCQEGEALEPTVLADALDLRPLERKRLLAVAAGEEEPTVDGVAAQRESTASRPDALRRRYVSLRARLWGLKVHRGEELQALASAGTDEKLLEGLEGLRAAVREVPPLELSVSEASATA